jgi:hypothetical protein
MVNNPPNMGTKEKWVCIETFIKECKNQLEKLRKTLSMTCWMTTILSVITLAVSIALLAYFFCHSTPLAETTTTTITDTATATITTTTSTTDTDLKSYIPAGLAAVLLIVLLLYNPVKRILRIAALMSQVTLAISGFTAQACLLCEKIYSKRKTSHDDVKEAIVEVREAIEKVKEAIKKGQISPDEVKKAIEELEDAVKKGQISPDVVIKAIEKLEKAVNRGQISPDKVIKAIEKLEKAVEKLEKAVDGEQKAIDEAIECISKRVEDYVRLIQECIEEV